MGIEGPNMAKKKETLPAGLPFKVERGKKHAEGGESEVWEVEMGGEKDTEGNTVVLKISKDETFATPEEMQNAERFYRLLKDAPGFGKFVPDTIYFKTENTEGNAQKAFCIQQFIPGERIDRLSDDQIYKNPVVVNQLLELANASMQLLQTTRKNDAHNPDFMRSPEWNNINVLFGALVFDPRYSSNIHIADKPNASGQQVFFVDVGVNANARRKKGWEWHGRKAINLITEFQFNMWKKKLEAILAEGVNPKVV